MAYFDSDLHAILAGGITAVLDFRNLEHGIGRGITVTPRTDDQGNYLPEWAIKVAARGDVPESVFRLKLEQVAP